MNVSPAFQSLATIASRLPFHLNETEHVNAAYRRWREQGEQEAKYIVELWTYCFVRRYFLYKFVRYSDRDYSADMDGLIETVYVKVQESQRTIADPARYAGWVSVVCRRAFLNYLRGRNLQVSLDQEKGAHLRAEDLHGDPGLVMEGLQQAIGRLPEFLREVAYLRFVEDHTYPEIGHITGKPLPTIRSYVNKALAKIRSDPHFLAFISSF